MIGFNLKRLRRRKGASAVEYALLIGLIGIAIITAVTNTGQQVGSLFDTTRNALRDATDNAGLGGGGAGGGGGEDTGGGEDDGDGDFEVVLDDWDHSDNSSVDGTFLEYGNGTMPNTGACAIVTIVNQTGSTASFTMQTVDSFGTYSPCSTTCSGTLAAGESCTIGFSSTSNSPAGVDLQLTGPRGQSTTMDWENLT